MTTITVATTDELYAALASARGGETILLEGGEYQDVSIHPKYVGASPDYLTPVTIKSADSADPAIFPTLKVFQANNVLIDGVVLDYEFDINDPIHVRPFNITDSSNITIQNSLFLGDYASGLSELDNGFGYGIGLSVRGSSDISVIGNEFQDFHRSIVNQEVENLEILGNEIHSMRSDGLNFSAVQNVLIEGNYIHNFRASSASQDHQDMIQFWTNGTSTPNTDITIRGNKLDIGTGSWTQSIFMRNEEVDTGRAGPEMYYRNILIEENTIVNSHLHGISLGEADGVTVRNNTVVRSDGGDVDGRDSGVEIPRINMNENSRNVTIEGNITSEITGDTGRNDWSIQNNLFVQDQESDAPGWYGDVFVASSLTYGADGHTYLALPGSEIHTRDIGAAATRDVGALGANASLFHVQTDADNPTRYVFDASLSLELLDAIPAGSAFNWSFGDGSTAQGLVVEHRFAEAGVYQTRLDIIAPDGRTFIAGFDAAVGDSRVLDLGADGTLQSYNFGETYTVAEGLGAAGIVLPGTAGTSLSVGRDHIGALTRSPEFDISFTIAPAEPGTWGEIFRVHPSLIASVGTDGNLDLVTYWDGGGNSTLSTSSRAFLNADAHDVSLRLFDGTLEIWIDGVLQASVATPGPVLPVDRDLTFGNPWGGKNFEGLITDFSISVNESAYPDSPQTIVLEPSPGDTTPPGPAPEPAPVPTVDDISFDDPGADIFIDPALIEAAIRDGSFGFEVVLNPTAGGVEGPLFWLPSTVFAEVNGAGELVLVSQLADGRTAEIVSVGAGLDDNAMHRIAIQFDGDQVEVLVDGAVIVSDRLPAPLDVTSIDRAGDRTLPESYAPDAGASFASGSSTAPAEAASPPAQDFGGGASGDLGGAIGGFTLLSDAAIAPPPAPEPEPEPVLAQIGEVHTMRLNHNATALKLDSSYDNPVVIAKSSSFNGNQPVEVRVVEVGPTEITLMLDEADYLDGWHAVEDVTVFVVEAGVHVLEDGTRIEAGTVETAALSHVQRETISFESDFAATPTILSQVQSFNEDSFAITRQTDQSETGFQLALQEEEAQRGTSKQAETLGWVAIEQGTGALGNMTFEAGATGQKVDHTSDWVGFETAFEAAPVLLAEMSSIFGGDTATLRVEAVSDSGFRGFLQEETSRDKETWHVEERVDYIAFESTGALMGYDADASGPIDSIVPLA